MASIPLQGTAEKTVSVRALIGGESPIGGKLGDRTGARTEFTDGYRGKVVVYHLDTNDMTLYHNQDHGR